MKKALILWTVLLVVIGFTLENVKGVSTKAAANTNAKVSFHDVKGHWAKTEIELLTSKGVINGYPDGTFKPEGTISRAQFSKILSGLMGFESNNLSFSSIKGHWSESYINGLVEEGIIVTDEYSNGYYPNGPITRIEMAKMLGRALVKESLLWNDTLSGFEQRRALKLPFKDQSELSPSDKTYIALVNSSGIVGGREDGTFNAKGLATRAQATVMLNRYLTAIKQSNIETTNKMLEYEMYTVSNIAIGDSAKYLIEKRGNPDRKSISRKGFTWYIYNNDYQDFAQYGIKNDQVVALYSNARNWNSTFGIQPEIPQSKVKSVYKEIGASSFNSYQYSNYETFKLKNQTIKLFYDYYDSQKVQAVFVTEPEYFFNSKKWDSEVIDSMEKQVFDMANASRVQNGLKPYSWNDNVALVARKHSADMADRNYFSHYSPEGNSPFDRLRSGGVSNCGGGENIYMSPEDAMSAHQGWMNSLGHRNNILNASLLEQLGVGIAVDQHGTPYYTQNMISSCY